METLAPDTEVRLAVSRCLRTLAASTDTDSAVAALQTLHFYVDDGAEGGAASAQRAEFRRAHFTRTLQFLVSDSQAERLAGLAAARRTELWDGLFLKGPPEQALLVLMEAMGELRCVGARRGEVIVGARRGEVTVGARRGHRGGEARSPWGRGEVTVEARRGHRAASSVIALL